MSGRQAGGGPEFSAEFWHRLWDPQAAGVHDAGSDRPERESDGAPPSAPAAMASAAANPYIRAFAAQTAANAQGPRTALEVGCGAGAESIALSRAGWQVTAVDLSQAALDRAAARAAEVGVSERITWTLADAVSWEPQETFDLVTSSYMHTTLPATEMIRHLAGWTAPDGTLLFIGHGPTHGEAHGHSHHPHDAEHRAHAALTPKLLESALDPQDWEIRVTGQTRTVVTGSGHLRTLDDVVLHARRHP